MNVLLTGGAGYIGSHLVRVLAAAGHRPVVYDNLSKGHAQALQGVTASGEPVPLIRGDIADVAGLTAALRQHRIDAVIHLAAFIEAGESVRQPAQYFRNNTVGGLAVLEAMQQAGVKRLVFSSTAAVYGNPRRVPIREDDPAVPINPYGASKLAVELMLPGFAEAHGAGCVALRYFNVAGADPAGRIGEDHDPETHLIPLVLQVALGRPSTGSGQGRPAIRIFGSDYDTPDGTCIRDYIHVLDLSAAHVRALDACQSGQVKVFNLGNGEGFSVKQVIDACRAVTGHAIPAEAAARREGDPARLVASADKARAELGWQPTYPDIQTIIAHAWAWHKSHPRGYQ